MTRDEAIAEGRRAGQLEARSRGEDEEHTADRISRAAAYAAWEYDGSPLDAEDRYLKEFGLSDQKLLPSLERVLAQPKPNSGSSDDKKEKKWKR